MSENYPDLLRFDQVAELIGCESGRVRQWETRGHIKRIRSDLAVLSWRANRAKICELLGLPEGGLDGLSTSDVIPSK